MWKVGGKIVDGDVTHIASIQLQVSLLRNSIYWFIDLLYMIKVVTFTKAS